MATFNLIALSGSLRKGSYNTALLRAFKEHAPEGVSIEIVDIGNLPLYNQDMEAEFPQVATDLKDKIKAADGIILATPEYNRLISAALKNAMEWSSRPYGDNAWAGKPVFVVGTSSGNISTALAQYSAKQTLTYLNAHVLGQPEFYVAHNAEKFDEQGNLTDEDTKKHIDTALQAFTAFVSQLR